MPRVSVVLPAYNSHATVSGCLEALRGQTFRDFETIVVDSSPLGETAAIVEARFPEVRCEWRSERLLPHAARNLGMSRSAGELVIHSDPDTYARPDWIERLVGAHDATGHVVVGSLVCHGRRWIDVGVHLCKFSKLLPGGAPRPVDIAPTANMLASRSTFEAVGELPSEGMQGDAEWSRRARQQQRTLWFEPSAVVEHHHLETLCSFIRERARRGEEFGRMRSAWLGGRRGWLLLYLLVSALPVRLIRVLALTWLHCWRAASLWDFVWTSPLVIAGHVSSLLGESRAYARWLAGSPDARTAVPGA